MILIAHRGNRHGRKPILENSPKYIDQTLNAGFDSEVDLWVVDGVPHLGHDGPEHKVDKRWFTERADSLWVHCKNFDALDFCLSNEVHCFYHNADDYTLTSKGYIWAYPLKEFPGDKTICVLPELGGESVSLNDDRYAGICSDYVGWTHDV